MRWKTKTKPTTRIKIAFALLPTKLDNGYSVWLQFYYLKEQYIEAGEYWAIIETWD